MGKKVVRLLVLLAITLTACDRIIYPAYQQDELWSFVVFGDTRGGYEIFGELSEIIGNIEPAPHAAFCCGDIVEISTNEADWLTFADKAKSISQKMPIFYARGNHDGNDTVSENLFRNLTGLNTGCFYYAHREENTLFIILDTFEKGAEHEITGEQLKWLKNQLDSTSSDPSILNVFLLMHQSPYPQGKHSGENLKNADDLHQLFLKYGKIRAIFSGHDHLFNKYVKDSLVYITTGGGGSPLYSGYGGDYHHFLKVTFYEDSTHINIKTVGLLNDIIDDFDL
jgi:acid phosphatase type 7